jgi:hypothetical protein
LFTDVEDPGVFDDDVRDSGGVTAGDVVRASEEGVRETLGDDRDARRRAEDDVAAAESYGIRDTTVLAERLLLGGSSRLLTWKSIKCNV